MGPIRSLWKTSNRCDERWKGEVEGAWPSFPITQASQGAKPFVIEYASNVVVDAWWRRRGVNVLNDNARRWQDQWNWRQQWGQSEMALHEDARACPRKDHKSSREQYDDLSQGCNHVYYENGWITIITETSNWHQVAGGLIRI